MRDIYQAWQTGINYKNIPELCESANIEEIREANYSLAPSKYVEFIDRDLEINYDEEMNRIQNEMREVLKIEKESQKALEEAFKGIGYEV